VIRDICRCKHCGRWLDTDDQGLSLRIGLDADECSDQARCIGESIEKSPAVADAINDLYRLRDALMFCESDYLTRLYAEADARAAG
jgi:hypothetical protein